MIYLVGDDNRIYKSTNSGSSFAQISSPTLLQIRDIAVNPANSDIVYVATDGNGLKVSTDGGLVFNDPSAGSISASTYVYSVVVSSTGTAYALTGDGPHVSSNNGASWTSIKGTIPNGSFSGHLVLNAAENLCFVNTDSRKVYFYTSGWSSGVSYPHFISAARLTFGQNSATDWFLASFTNGVYKTDNGGANWSSANGSMKALNTFGIFVTGQGRIFVAYGGQSYYQSVDNGSTWLNTTVANTDRTILGFLKLADASVLAYGAGVIRSTGTIGDSWTVMNNIRYFPQIVTNDGINLYGIAFGDISKSTDQGATWIPTVISGLSSGNFRKIQIDINGNLYVNQWSSDSLYKINAGGTSATYISDAIDFSIVNSGGKSTIYALRNALTLRISTNNGLNWIDKTIPISVKIWGFKNDVVLTAGYSNSLNVSYNSGNTWAEYSLPDIYGSVTDVVLSENDVAYIATSNSVAYKSTNNIIRPRIVTFSPAHQAVSVSSSSSIEFTFDREVTSVAGKTISLYLTANLNTPVQTYNVNTLVQQGNNKFTLNPGSVFQANTQYSITIEAGAFMGNSGNLSEAITTSNWQFTTAPQFQIATIFPAHQAVSVSMSSLVEITFDRTVTPVSGKAISLYLTANPGTPIQTYNVNTLVQQGNKFTLNPGSVFQDFTQYSIAVAAGSFIDNNGNESAAISASNWQFTTAPRFQIATFFPAHQAVSVSMSSLVDITFDRTVTPISGKTISLYLTANLSTPIQTYNVNTLVQQGNKFTLNPGSVFQDFTQYSIAVAAGAFIDNNGNENATIPATNWTFRTIDATPPSIGFTPVPASLDKGFSMSTFSATAVDNSGSVAGVKLYHRNITEDSYSELAGSLNTSSGKWEFPVSGSFFDNIGMEYYFTATDLNANVGRSPAGKDTHKTYLAYKGNDTKIPGTAIGIGGTAKDWKIFAVPFELGTSNKIATIFDELTDDATLVNKFDYRIITYKDDQAWAEYPGADLSTIERGRGYFINIRVQRDIFIGASLTAPQNDRSNLFAINLKTGWNMIGNPYLTPIDWANVTQLNGLTGTVSTLKVYSGSISAYSNATILQPFTGGFVLSDADIQNVKIPFQGQTSVGGRTSGEIEGADLGNSAWLVPFTLAQGDVKTNLGGVGMHPIASLSRDEFDDFNPPRFLDYLEMNFDHPEHIAKKFTRDVVTTQHEYAWEFTVDSHAEGWADLSWDNTAFGNNSKELYLFDVHLQQPIDMRATNHYVFYRGESSKFRIYFGEELKRKINPDYVTLGKAFPNPVSEKATINFGLPETCPCRVQLEIFDNFGRRIETLTNGFLAPDFYAVEWNVSDKNLARGLYTYRLTVNDKYKGHTALSGHIILN